MDNLNILVEAKREYLGQMCLIMSPAMIEVFQDMYNEAVTNVSKITQGSPQLVQRDVKKSLWQHC